MRYVLVALALVSCAADPLPPTGPAAPYCPPYVRCTFGGECLDMQTFCSCAELRQDKFNDCVSCELESGKKFIPQTGGGCFFALPKKP